ncbi:MAG: TonB-dependent receptor, partial [Chitinophagales bacterium]|nr:TonB-dependent receptor [Chitinophagales bacterium]
MNKLFFIIALNFICIYLSFGFSDSLPPKKLGDVEIVELYTGHRKKNNQIENQIIFAGKKNELILLKNNTLNTVDNSARQIFSKVPGISVWENDGSGVQVNIASRGLSPNRSWEFNIRQNGYDISSDPYGYPEAYFNPPMEAVSKIQILRGAAAVQFGSQFGGLVNYIVHEPPTDKTFDFNTRQTLGSFNMINSYNQIGGTIDKFSYIGYYNYKNADGFRSNSGYNIHNGYLRLGYTLNKNLKINVEASALKYILQQAGGLTDNQFSSNIKQSNRSRNWFNINWFVPNFNLNYSKGRHQFDLKIFGLVGERNSIGYVRAINVPDTINNQTGAYNHRQIDRDYYKNIGSEGRYLFNYNISGFQQNIAIGARYFYGTTRRAQNGKGDTQSDFNLNLQDSLFGRDLKFVSQNIALFGEHVFRFKNLSIIPGIRLEVLQNTSEGYLSRNTTTGELNYINPQRRWRVFPLAALGLEYTIARSTEIYANASQAYRPVLFSDLTPSATTDSISKDLKDANGFNFDLGYRGNISNWFDFDISGFYIIYKDRIGTIAEKNESGSIYQLRKNLGVAHHRGIEAYIGFDPIRLSGQASKLGSIKLWTSIAYINAIYVDFPITKIESGNIVVDNLKNKRVENAPEFIARAGVILNYKSFELNFLFNYVSGTYADATNTKEPNSSATIGFIPAYNVMDLNFSYRFMNDRLLVKGGITNLTNRRYFTRRAGGYPGPGVLPA